MVDVRTEIVIDESVDVVSEYGMNPDNAPEWYVNIKSIEWQTPKPLGIGSKLAFKAHFLGKELSYIYEIVELTPKAKLVMRTADGPFPMETTYTWSALDNGSTRMTLRNRGNPKGFSKILAPFMAMMMRKANNKDLRKIKEVIETRK